jgi:hypothetical protein
MNLSLRAVVDKDRASSFTQDPMRTCCCACHGTEQRPPREPDHAYCGACREALASGYADFLDSVS